MDSRNDRADVYANVGVHTDVEIMDVADEDSLAPLAEDGARRLRARATASGFDLASGGR